MRERADAPPPPIRLGVELPASGGGDFVETGPAPTRGLGPRRAEPAGALHPVQGREQRPRLDLEDVPGDLLDPAGNAEPVQRTGTDSAKNEQLQRAWQDRTGGGR